MGTIDRFGRFWTVMLPAVLLAATFKYAYQLNSIINSIEGMSFEKTLAIMFISFLAMWSLLYLGSVFFVRAMRWIWNGTTPIQIEKPSVYVKKELEHPAKNDIEYQSVKEQENLFKLDLQDEPISSPNEEEYVENRVLK